MKTEKVILCFALVVIMWSVIGVYGETIDYVLGDRYIVMDDDFDSSNSVVDTGKWTMWQDPGVIDVDFYQAGSAACVDVNGVANQGAGYSSVDSFDPYDQNVITEFIFTQTMNHDMVTYAWNHNYIRTTPGGDTGFEIWWIRYQNPGVGQVQLYQTIGGTKTLLYDSGTLESYLGSVSFSLVLEDNNWEFYWYAGLDGVTIVPAATGTHDINDPLHLGFGVYPDWRSTLCGTKTHYAGVAQRPRSLPTEDVNVVVSSNVVQTGLNPYSYVTVTFDQMSDKTYPYRPIFDTDHNDPDSHYNSFINFLNEVCLKTFRYPGGNYTRFLFYGVPASEWYASSGRGGDEESWIEIEEFFEFLADGNFRTVLQLNSYQYWDPNTSSIKLLEDETTKVLDMNGLSIATEAVSNLIAWVNNNDYGQYINIWEIGNLDEAYAQEPENYAKIAASFIREINNVYPNAEIMVGGDGAITTDLEQREIRATWMSGVLQTLTAEGIKDQVDHFGQFLYAYQWAESTAYQEFATYTGLEPDHPFHHPWGVFYDQYGQPVSVIDREVEMLDKNGFTDHQIYWNEYKLGVNSPYHKAVASGLGHLHMIMIAISHPRMSGGSIHSLLHASRVTEEWLGDPYIPERPFSDWGFSVAHYVFDDRLELPTFVNTPVSEIFKIVWAITQGDLIQATSSNSGIRVIASKDDETVRVLIYNGFARPRNQSDINGDPTAQHLANVSNSNGDRFDLNLALPENFLPSVQKLVTVSALGEEEELSDVSAIQGTFIADDIKLKKSTINISGQHLNYVLEPHSAVLFEITNNYCGGTTYNPGDINMNCYIDIEDLLMIVGSWLACYAPNNPECNSN